MSHSAFGPLLGPRLPLHVPGGVPRPKLELIFAERRMVTDETLRVTLAGFDLAFFPAQGGDQRCVLLLPWRDAEAWRYVPPVATDPWSAAAQYGFVAALSRPLRRRLTVSDFRPEQLEIDFDIVLHGESPLTTWARRAELGSRVEIFNEGRRYRVAENTRWQLLIADGSGVPAALGIANETPASVPTTLYLAGVTSVVAGLEAPGDHVTVIHVPPTTDRRQTGTAVTSVLLKRSLPMTPDQVGIAGERSFTRLLSRELQRAGVPRHAIQAAGSYWRTR